MREWNGDTGVAYKFRVVGERRPRKAVIRPPTTRSESANRVVLIARRSLPIYPDERTSKDRAGMSQKCQEATSQAWRDMKEAATEAAFANARGGAVRCRTTPQH